MWQEPPHTSSITKKTTTVRIERVRRRKTARLRMERRKERNNNNTTTAQQQHMLKFNICYYVMFGFFYKEFKAKWIKANMRARESERLCDHSDELNEMRE